MNTDLMFSSVNQKWETPEDMISHLSKYFTWDLDVCASRDNVCDNYYDGISIDGLKTAWNGLCWMNPPYGRDAIKWVRRAWFYSHQKNIFNSSMATTVCLLPSRTDTKLFHTYAPKASLVVFIQGRLKFGSDEFWAEYWQQAIEEAQRSLRLDKLKKYKRNLAKIHKNPAPFGSIFMVFGNGLSDKQTSILKAYGVTMGVK